MLFTQKNSQSFKSYAALQTDEQVCINVELSYGWTEIANNQESTKSTKGHKVAYNGFNFSVLQGGKQKQSAGQKSHEMEDDIIVMVECPKIMNLLEIEMLHYTGFIT